MKRQLQVAALALLSAFIILPSAFGQGSLTPSSAPTPTMKSLDQIEARTPISSAPFTISAPGSYYLTKNLTVSSGDAITITTNGVTLDLNGFTISSTAASATGTGILFSGGVKNITIANGFIQGGVTNSGGTYSGSGFSNGISYSGLFAAVNVVVSRISVSGCLNFGINLSNTSSMVVENCTVLTVGGQGIIASTVKTSTATDCGDTAISGDQVSDCRGQATVSGWGIIASAAAMNCYGSGIISGVNAATAYNCFGSSTSGSGVSAFTAQNCYGGSTSGFGVSADSAANCRGSSSSNYGINASVARDCYGVSSSNRGVSAVTAQNCYGTSSSGVGLNARTAQNCYGESSGSSIPGISVSQSASNCYGVANGPGGYGILGTNAVVDACYGYGSNTSSGYGIAAYLANASRGVSGALPASQNAVVYSYKYNMP